MQRSAVVPYQKWHWAGDEIVHEPIIPGGRAVPGTKISRYRIDIREFLALESDALIRHHVNLLVKELDPTQAAFFRSTDLGAFDFRARLVSEYVARFGYIRGSRRFDQWLFPAETLAQEGGDCEDLAFLFAALLEASGISAYCIRVAFGSVSGPAVTGGRCDHAWVVYLNEDGAWEILEPSAFHIVHRRKLPNAVRATNPPITGSYEYTPNFVFNRQHLWRVRSSDSRTNETLSDYLAGRRFWSEFDPTFAASVHNSIFDDALIGMATADRDVVKRYSLLVDADVLNYDPRDHFDFSYIDESWARVRQRLSTGQLSDFAYATHAIADFYAHSIYGDDNVGARDGDGNLIPYNPLAPTTGPTHDFSKYMPLPGATHPRGESEAHWNGKLISGQWWRWFTTFPSDLKEDTDGLAWRRCLPDHDAIAVDGATPKPEHKRYDEAEYQIQFALRRGAAVKHIANAFAAWKL